MRPTWRSSVLRTVSGTSRIRPRTQWGELGDVPGPGDYDGNGTIDLRIGTANGTWYVKGQPPIHVGGQTGDIPIPADYNRDGATGLSIFRHLTVSGTASRPIDGVGRTGDVPVPGDYDGNGTTDLAVYRPSPTAPGTSKTNRGSRAGGGQTATSPSRPTTTATVRPTWRSSVLRTVSGTSRIRRGRSGATWRRARPPGVTTLQPGESEFAVRPTLRSTKDRLSDGLWYINGQTWTQWGGTAGDIPLKLHRPPPDSPTTRRR